MLTRKASPGNFVLSYYTYDVASRLKQMEHKKSSLALISYYSYARNANGAPEVITHEGGENSYYTYDELDRLGSEIRKSGSTSIYSFSYSLDAASNRVRQKGSAGSIYYTYDNRNLLTAETGAVTYSYSYDAAQRMTKIHNATRTTYFHYNQRNMVTSIPAATGGGTSNLGMFRYNGAGERVQANEGADATTWTYWTHDGGKLLLERTNALALVDRYRHNQSAVEDVAGSVIEVEDAAEATDRFYPATDERATASQLVNQNDGSVVERNLFDRFGVVLGQSDDFALKQRLRFVTPVFVGLQSSSEFLLTAGGGLWVPRIGIDVAARTLRSWRPGRDIPWPPIPWPGGGEFPIPLPPIPWPWPIGKEFPPIFPPLPWPGGGTPPSWWPSPTEVPQPSQTIPIEPCPATRIERHEYRAIELEIREWVNPPCEMGRGESKVIPHRWYEGMPVPEVWDDVAEEDGVKLDTYPMASTLVIDKVLVDCHKVDPTCFETLGPPSRDWDPGAFFLKRTIFDRSTCRSDTWTIIHTPQRLSLPCARR